MSPLAACALMLIRALTTRSPFCSDACERARARCRAEPDRAVVRRARGRAQRLRLGHARVDRMAGAVELAVEEVAEQARVRVRRIRGARLVGGAPRHERGSGHRDERGGDTAGEGGTHAAEEEQPACHGNCATLHDVPWLIELPGRSRCTTGEPLGELVARLRAAGPPVPAASTCSARRRARRCGPRGRAPDRACRT